MRRLKVGVIAFGLLAVASLGIAFYLWPALPPTVRAPIVYRLSHHQIPWDGCFFAYVMARADTGASKPLDQAGGTKVAQACRPLAERGDGPAATLMAEAEIGRWSNSEDGAKAAFKWLQRGTEADYGPAFLGLGMYYMIGRGTAKDPVKANAAIIAAAQHGDALAQYMAARGYEMAIGTPEDLVQSLGWYTVLLRSSDRAREAGVSPRDLERTVAAIAARLTPEQVAQANAFADAFN